MLQMSAIAAYFDPGPNARPCAANSNGASDAVACRKPDHAAASRRVTDTSGWHSRSDDGSYLAAASRRVADTTRWRTRPVDSSDLAAAAWRAASRRADTKRRFTGTGCRSGA